MTLAALLGFATIGSGIGLIATSAWLIATAALHPSIADLQVAIVGVRFFGIARGVFRYLERNVTHQVTFRLLARLRVRFYSAIEPLAPAGLLRHRAGDLLTRAVADIETLQNFYGRVLAPPLVALLVVLAMWAFTAAFDASLAHTLVALLLLAGVAVPLATHLLSRAPGRRLIAARAELNAVLVEGIQGVADLSALGQTERWTRRVHTLSGELVRWQRRMAWVTGVHSALGSLLTSLAAIAVLLIAVPLVNSGRLEGVYLAVLVLAAVASFEAVLPLPQAAQHLESALQAAKRLLEIGDWGSEHVPLRGVPSEARNDEAIPNREVGDCFGLLPKPRNDNAARLHSQLSIAHLRFRYSPDAPFVLDDINLSLPVGGRVAIVGPSGAGKSTLVNLLLRFWDYTEGSIGLEGRELRDYLEQEVRAKIGVVAQSTFLFNATLRENLLLARPEASAADLERVVAQAQLDAFVRSLPNGYDTWIGEQGMRLSGGERQRLAIARALLKDAPILILDEPTANLDTLTERAVMQAIKTLMQGRTTLLITHRLVGLEDADEIVVLRAGRIIERGRHDELMQMNGIYRRMRHLQMTAFIGVDNSP